MDTNPGGYIVKTPGVCGGTLPQPTGDRSNAAPLCRQGSPLALRSCLRRT